MTGFWLTGDCCFKSMCWTRRIFIWREVHLKVEFWILRMSDNPRNLNKYANNVPYNHGYDTHPIPYKDISNIPWSIKYLCRKFLIVYSSYTMDISFAWKWVVTAIHVMELITKHISQPSFAYKLHILSFPYIFLVTRTREIKGLHPRPLHLSNINGSAKQLQLHVFHKGQ